MSDPWMVAFGAGVFGLVGGLLVWLAVSDFRSTRELLATASVAAGRVTRIEKVERREENGGNVSVTSTALMTVEYEWEGERRQIVESSALYTVLFSVGDSIRVFIPSTEEGDVKIDAWIVLYGTSFGIGFLGLMFLAGATLVWVVMR